MTCPECKGEGIVEVDGLLHGCWLCDGWKQVAPATVSALNCHRYIDQVVTR